MNIAEELEQAERKVRNAQAAVVIAKERIAELEAECAAQRRRVLAEVEELRSRQWNAAFGSYKCAWDEFTRELHRLLRAP